MELDRMWDIAGCRCILNSEEKANKLKYLLCKEFHVVKENNYYESPPNTGYRSIHLYLTDSPDDKWPVEVQLRTRKDHNWATLVEIIDQIYEKSLKEGEQDEDFNEFLILISRLPTLQIDEKCRAIHLAHKLNVFQKLYSVFLKNYLKVREDWLVLNKPKHHHFFVIEVEGDKPIISSYDRFKEAEIDYFKKFSTSIGTNIVLTYLPQSNFENLETAYSNYTLTTHSIIDDYFQMLSDVCGFLLKQKNFKSFYRFFSNSQEIFYSSLANIDKEFRMIEDAINVDRRKAKYWEKDFRKRIKKRVKIFNQLSKEIERFSPSGGFSSLIFNYYVWRIDRRDKQIQKQILG